MLRQLQSHVMEYRGMCMQGVGREARVHASGVEASKVAWAPVQLFH